MTKLSLVSQLRRAAALAAGLIMVNSSTLPAEEVDLELLMAVDVSPSVNAREYFLQMRGVADALRDPEIVKAVTTSAPEGVALALMEWAGPGEETISVPWSKIRDQASADAFAEKIENTPRFVSYGGTAIGDALTKGIALLTENDFQGKRQIIDISADGPTNEGDSPGPVRADAASSGITINGLVILNEEKHLRRYFEERVIVGPDAFVLEVKDLDDFAVAMRLKLMREIDVAMGPTSFHR